VAPAPGSGARVVVTPLAGFEAAPHTHLGVSRVVYRAGSGPAVVIMHEIPGITPQVAAFARRVAGAGFSVWMPELFGETGAPGTVRRTVREVARACVAREFATFALGKTSPITDWLRLLCREAHAACGGPGVGALGMCLTGNFALALMVDPTVVAPVLSQPSLPFTLSPAHARDLAVSAGDLALIKARDCPVLGLRFHGDPMCPGARFRRLEEDLGRRFEGIELPRSSGNPAGNPIPHSVLTNDLVDAEGEPTRAALDRVLSFFAERLLVSTEERA
jgi:dienelactone hydrolase